MVSTGNWDPRTGRYRGNMGTFLPGGLGSQPVIYATFTSFGPARARLAAAIARAESEMRKMLIAAAYPLESRWKELVHERAYRTGRYYDSIRTEVNDNLEVTVGTDAVNEEGHPYPVDLEFGTRFMAARPTWRPAIDEASPAAEAAARAVFIAYMASI